ncbi:MAG: 30S ribosome-binding factor RbfA [Candidatus Liberibacter europaeus]|uniref:Ribosome-binding factor A n=1 Tax=Candidatus Liberibacter europaeus TaxID=744859 RepID=A0A2T4VZ10_9HYPH|nr:30S ribosome-binding factor RbfA [Candidatus Liberibacter europaeus]PTL87019.1 MAG: 30S ribosome-binding factor RbfA [Candidatus Liberibacter europaeus]
MKSRVLQPSRRALRVGEEVRSVLMSIILNYEFKDNLIDRNIISIPEVRMSSDLQVATAYVYVSSDISPDRVINALNCNSKFIRKRICRSLRNLRYIPEIRFRYDGSLQNYWNIDRLMRSSSMENDLKVDDAV